MLRYLPNDSTSPPNYQFRECIPFYSVKLGRFGYFLERAGSFARAVCCELEAKWLSDKGLRCALKLGVPIGRAEWSNFARVET